MPAPAKLKGRYELKEVLAKGGMGVVYRAVDGVMRRQVAIKTLLDMTDAMGLQLFQKECEVLASMTHPNIIEIYDVGEFEQEGVSRPYLVMPLLPGVTLDKLIRASSQRLTVERSIDIACQACRGLQAAHEKGLVHRDIKPSNIFVLEDDSIKIIDFGVAHRIEASRTGGRKGTLLFMAPEQIEMKPVSAASDIFSLGVVVYEMLTRRRPFERASESSVADAILHSIQVPASELNPAVNQAVSQAIHKAMAKQPWHRYASAKEFAETLQKAVRNEPIEIFNPARMRPRLQRAIETLERGDCQYAAEIVGELEGEGHLDTAISDLRRRIDDAIRRKTVAQLLDTAHSRIETEEYPLALQRIYEVLQLDPTNVEALSLKGSVENKRTERDMEEWFRLAGQHLGRFDFNHAREALQRILQLRPKDGRALQMLSEVGRLEQEHTRARQEKEQLYQAAVVADQRGDISSALSKLERVLDLDRRVPDAAAPERATNYQNLYNKVRSEHESMQRAYVEAKHQLESADFQAALSSCAAQLTKYPENALFQALKIDVEEQHRQALSARIAETDRKVESEPDLDRRIAIVEDAVKTNPGERHFEQLLQRTREKRKLIESIVVRARMHEQQAQFSEALSQWEIVRTIYDLYPGLTMEIERVVRRRDQHVRLEARNRWVEQIDRTLETQDYDRALSLLASAQAEHPGDTELAQLEKLARQGLEKAAEVRRLVALGQEECAAGRRQYGVVVLSRAHELDDRNPVVTAALREALVGHARGIIDTDPSAAEQLLHRALQIEPEDGEAKGLLSLIQDHRRHAAVDHCVSEVRQLQSQADLRAAVAAVEQGLQTFPTEARLIQLHASLKKSLEEIKHQELEEARRLRQDAPVPVEEPTLPTYSGRLEEPSLLSGVDTDLFTAAEAVRRASEQPPVPVVEEEEVSPTPEVIPAKAPPPKTVSPQVRTIAVWQRGLTLVKARPKLWGGGALAGLAVLLLILFVSRRSGPPPPPPTPPQGTLAITTSPSGAAVLVNGKPAGTALAPLQFSLPPGSVEIEARLPGFQTARTTVNLAAGARLAVPLALAPVLALKLQFPSEGRVAINDEEPVTVQDGQFLRELPVGAYSVKFSTGRSTTVAFKFEVRADGPAAITGPPAVQGVSALFISSFGDQARIYTGVSSVDVNLDGQALGQLDKNGLDLPKLSTASHELVLTTGKDVRKHTIEITPERSLTAIIESDPNTGTLLVQTNEEGAAIVVRIPNGKDVKRGNSKKGPFRVGNLKAGKYLVSAVKEGYDVDLGEQQAEVVKGEDKTVSFVFRPRPQSASVRVRLTPGSELFVDGSSLGTISEDNRTVPGLKAGPHIFKAQKGRQFQPAQKSIEVTAGQTSELDLRLGSVLPVPVEISKRPPDSKITYTRVGDASVHDVTGTRLELPEGTYTFRADADGYLQRKATEIISWDSVRTIDLKQDVAPKDFTIADWDKGLWTPKDDYFDGKPGLILFPKPLSYVRFTIHAQGGKARAHWILHYVNEKNYIDCVIDDDGFRATRISDGKREVIANKPVAKTYWYPISIEIRANGATVSLQKGNSSELLAELTEPGFGGTKFGFNVPVGQQLFLSSPSFLGRP